jgi:MarR family transcriptional regulator for hemolysin
MAETRAEIGALWWEISRQMHERFRQSFREYAMQPMGMGILRQVAHEPGVTVSELARRLHTVKSHVSKLVDQLIQQGYLEKRPDPADQRLIRIYPTQASLDMKAALESRARAIWAEVLADLPQAQVDEVVRGLQILRAALERSQTETGE